MKPKIIITCEHAAYESPEFIQKQVNIPKEILRSHLGWDEGAYDLAYQIAESLGAELHAFSISRLLIDSNRTLVNSLGPYGKKLNELHKKVLIKEYHSYRNAILKSVKKACQRKQRIYIFSIHSFTPIFNNKIRKTDIGILFRNALVREKALATELRRLAWRHLREQSLRVDSKYRADLAIHFNRPYQGHTDCFLNDLLDDFQNSSFVHGVFLEFNQRLLVKKKDIKAICELIVSCISSLNS